MREPQGTNPRPRLGPFLAPLVLATVLLALPAPPGAGAERIPGEASAPAAPIIRGVIDEEIGYATSAYLTRLLERVRAENAQALLLEINTFGGRVDAAVAMRDMLLDAPVTTIAYINKRAISAGALISLACQKIAISTGGTIGAATPIQVTPGSGQAKPVAEKYVSYFRQEMRATAEANGRNGDIAEAMVDADKEVPGVSEKGKLLTLSTEGALKEKIADALAASPEEVLAAFKIEGPLIFVGRTWSEQLVGFLTSQGVSSLLFIAMIALGYLEYQTAGFGYFGYGAIVCFLLLFFSHSLVNLAGWEELLIFSVGIVLILVELFVIPGFGVVGLLGIACVFVAAVLLLLAGDLGDLRLSNPFTLEAVFRVLLSAALSIAVLLALARFLPKEARRGGRLILASEASSKEGFTSHAPLPGEALAGMEGEVLSPLRPAGRVRIGERRLQAESEGDYIDKGERVRVLRVEPGRIVVRRL